VKVLHLVPAPFGTGNGIVGGAERYAFELARHMADAVPTRLVTFGNSDCEQQVGRLSTRTIGSPWFVRGQRSNPVALAMMPEIRRADIVHCHQQHVVASSLAAAVSRLTGRRVFATDLGGGGWDVSGYVSTDGWYHAHLHISEYSRDVAGHAGRPNAHVILGGVDTSRFCPDPAVPRDGTVLFVGRQLPHKGIDNLVRALDPDMRAEIVGRESEPRFAADLAALAHGKQVRFVHDCNDEQLVAAYRRAACIVLPSVYRDMYGNETRVPELLGLALLEGMACGAPAICTSVASLPEIVEDGVTGIIVPPNDAGALRRALRRILDEPAEAERMGRAARARVVERFTWPHVVARCLEIYAGS
jgi:glycosyltransferase involved in cell wall biosynthesis